MSTINPDAIDATKPEAYPAIATTSSVRANEQATKDQLGNAKTDIEALESGKEDAGTAAAAVAAHDGDAGAHPGTFEAAGAVAAHDASGAAHGGVEAAYTAHAADGAIHTTATYREAEKDSVPQSVGRSKIDFRDTGDATVTVTDDPGNDRTIVSIDATAGGGGGGVGAGAPFVVGDLTEVESDAGDGSIRSAGISSASVSGHIADGAIHYAQTAIDHTVILNRGTNTHAQLDAHVASVANPHSVTAAQLGALQNVAEDTTPQLGGDLETLGKPMIVTRSDQTEVGRIVHEDAKVAMAIGYFPDGDYHPSDGALQLGLGETLIGGAKVQIEKLVHSTPAGRQVYVSETGDLYGVDPPASGWVETDTDQADYDLGTPGAGVGAWVSIAGLVITTPQTLESSDLYDVTIGLTATNKSNNRTGSLEIYVSADGAVPGGLDVDGVHLVPAGFAGVLRLSIRDTADQQYPAGTTVSIYARAANGSGVGYGLDLFGSLGDHTMIVATPGEGGGGGSGDVVQGSPIGSNDDLTAWQSAAGKTLKSAGFGFADVARKSQANAFTAGQTIAVAAATSVVLDQTDAGANNRLAYFGNASGNIQLAALNDNQSIKANLVNAPGGAAVNVGDSGVPLTLASSVAIAHGANEILENGLAATIGAVGYAATPETHVTAAATPFKPEPLSRNFVELTGAFATTLTAMTEDGAVTLIIPDGLAIDLTAYVEIGAQPTGRVGILEARKIGTNLLAAWI